MSQWSSNSSILGFTQFNYHYDGSETLSRPIFSFQNFLKYFDPNSLTSSKGLMSLLTKFDRRLERFREDLVFLRTTTRHVTSAHAFMGIAAQMYLFHIFSPLPWTYRYPMSAPICTDYTDEDLYKKMVFSINSRNLEEEPSLHRINLQEQEQRYKNGIGGKRSRF